MKKIKLYSAASLDSYISRQGGDVSWLDEVNHPEGEDYGYQEFYDSIDTLIMGMSTYRFVLGMDIPWPYPGKRSIVLTRGNTNHSPYDEVEFWNQKIPEKVAALQKEPGKDIWLVGGGKVNSFLLNQGLIDEVQVTIIPILLGRGIRLFEPYPDENWLELRSVKSFESGVVHTVYQVARPKE